MFASLKLDGPSVMIVAGTAEKAACPRRASESSGYENIYIVKMKKEFKLFVIFYCLCTSVSCAQKERKNIAANFDQLKVPAERPLYSVRMSLEDSAVYRAFINDVPLMNGTAGSLKFFANSAILQSGEQAIKIVMNGKVKVASGSMTAEVIGPVRTEKRAVLKDTILWVYDGAENNKSEGNFHAQVPYQLAGWTKSKVINKDDEALLEKARTWFERMTTYLKEKSGDAFMGRLLKAETVAFTSNHLSAVEASQQHNGWVAYINKGEFNVVDIASKSIEIVGEGKLLHLVDKNFEGGLTIISPNGQTTFIDIFLHIPNNDDEFEAILINYKQITTDFRKRFN